MTSQCALLCLWSSGVLLSWVGWGRLAARWAVGRRRIDSGLCAAWGMAILVAIGGVLNATELCSRPIVLGLTAAGIALAVPTLWRSTHRMTRRPKLMIRRLLPNLPIVLAGSCQLLVSIGFISLTLNYIDDLPLYMVLPIRMLQSGTADDPLNGRRLSTYGGYAFLQSQVVAGGHPYAALVTDMGLAALVVAMLLVGLPRRGAARWAVTAIVLFGWLYPWPRLNTMAGTTLTAVVLGLWRTVRLADASRGGRRLRVLALAALVATAATTFRANVLVLPPVFFVLYFGHRLWRSRAAWRRVSKETVLVLAVGIAVLLPWAFSLYRSSGSFLYPLMRGNHRDSRFEFVKPGTTDADRLLIVWNTISSPMFVLASLPLVVLVWQRRWTGVWLYVSALVMSAATAWAFPTADPAWLARFCVPTLLAATLVGLDAVLRWNGTRVTATALIAGVSVLLMWPGDTPMRTAELYSYAVPIALNYQNRAPVPPEAVRAYAEMQQSVPPGATIAVALNFPLLLDFSRNPIYCLDTPGFATRHGLWPYFQGPQAARQFLIDQGVDYLAFQDFTTNDGMYEYRWWRTAAEQGESVAKYLVNTMEDFDALWQQSPHAYESGRVRLIRLR